MSNSEHQARATALLDSFWDDLLARGATRDEGILAAQTLWVQLIKDLPADEREHEIVTAEQVAKEAIAAPAEREAQARRAHLRLVHPLPPGSDR
jgi:hypothetical protein